MLPELKPDNSRRPPPPPQEGGARDGPSPQAPGAPPGEEGSEEDDYDNGGFDTDDEDDEYEEGGYEYLTNSAHDPGQPGVSPDLQHPSSVRGSGLPAAAEPPPLPPVTAAGDVEGAGATQRGVESPAAGATKAVPNVPPLSLGSLSEQGRALALRPHDGPEETNAMAPLEAPNQHIEGVAQDSFSSAHSGSPQLNMPFSEPASNMPSAPAYSINPEEAYELAAQEATTPFQRVALEQLREWDEKSEAHFSADQALELVRVLRDAQKAAKQEEQPKSLPWCNLTVWLGFGLVLIYGMVSLAAFIARDYTVDPSGLLVSSASGSVAPMAVGSAVTMHGFAELLSADVQKLRRVRDCSFSHEASFHRFRVASVVRDTAGILTITAPDMSRLRIRGNLGADAVSFTRPFHGEERINLGSPANADAGCSFAIQATSPARTFVESLKKNKKK